MEQLDSQHLSQLLLHMRNDLSPSFVERRSASHTNNPLEELQVAVKELTDRERQLQSAIQLGFHLLQKNDDLFAENCALQAKNTKKKTQVLSLKQQNHSLLQDLAAVEDKYQEASSALFTTEELMLALQANQPQITLKTDIKLEDDSTETTETEQLERKLNNARQHIAKLEKNCAKLENELEGTEKNYKELASENARFEKQVKKQTGLNAELKDELLQLQEVLRSKEDALYHAQLDAKRSEKRIQSLVDEVEVLEQCKSTTSTYSESNPECTPMNELAELDLFVESTPNPVLKTTNALSLVNITRQSKKEDFSEEYFMLAVQAIKMNSPYMDTICTVPPLALLKKALALGIPFHKWYSWIEDELNSIYIQLLYSRSR